MLKVGDQVEVLSAGEILATLDERGELDGLPFMPEMLRYCGRRMTVFKVAHKLCDTIEYTGIRRMRDAVHLAESRCDGSAHGGCQAACLIYWKTAWLRPVSAEGRPAATGPVDVTLLERATTKEPDEDGATRYSCQATEMLRAAPERLPLKDVRQFWWDYRTGNTGAADTLRGFVTALIGRIRARLGLGEARVIKGRAGTRTPVANLDLETGELVRVRSMDEIAETLDAGLRNRGMAFADDLTEFCGKTGRISGRIDRLIEESSGRMIEMKTPSLVIDGFVCPGRRSFNCPRSHLAYWREIWLERVPTDEG
ncbi:hypothetical protein [Nonomuraea sp. NPDC050310]|uniref:hypothetical protein n=1 Tax=Nonomuraea sp. NPDC050310 TaxID=3154935 RepID=UPI0033C97999